MKEDISQTTCKLLTRKGFSEKPLVAFTNRTVFLLDLYMGQVTLNGAKSVTRVKNLNPFLMKLFLVHWFG